MLFANNPELWKAVYASDMAEGSQGIQIREPTTEEDFEDMIREWQGEGYVPPES
jgi:hypothetical protein